MAHAIPLTVDFLVSLLVKKITHRIDHSGIVAIGGSHVDA